MTREIAVFAGADGESALLAGPGKVTVFRRVRGSWEIHREKEFALGQAGGMRELRLQMGEMLQFLGSCEIFVASSATGVPYYELEKAGRSVWEIPGRPEEFLEQVWRDEEQERSSAQSKLPETAPVPVEISPGNFYISIKDIQEKNAEVSSKQVLRQFLGRGHFRTLAVTCSHIPPWIEVEAMCCGLAVETGQQGKNEYTLRIIKK